MANDLMRTGPRGASDQASYLKPLVTQLIVGGAVIDQASYTGAMAQDVGSSNFQHPQGTVSPGGAPIAPSVFTAVLQPPTYVGLISAATSTYFGLPGMSLRGWNGEWRLSRLWVIANGNVTGNSGNLSVGVYAATDAHSVTTVDATALVPTVAAPGRIPQQILQASMTNIGDAQEILLSGVGAGLTDNGGAGAGLVSYVFGRGTGKHTSAAASVLGQNQFLGVSIPDNSGAAPPSNLITLFAEFIPVGGSGYSN